MSVEFTHRFARSVDIPAIVELMQISIAENMKPFLSPAEIEAVQESMGIDQSLLEDQTYFLIEADQNDVTILVGCGGWGKRKTLYGGDSTSGRDDSVSDPTIDAARIRAMYTHPAWIRRGIGTLLLELSENAARNAGFSTIELGSTVPGEPFYIARGYEEVSREMHVAANGAESVVIKMTKNL